MGFQCRTDSQKTPEEVKMLQKASSEKTPQREHHKAVAFNMRLETLRRIRWCENHGYIVQRLCVEPELQNLCSVLWPFPLMGREQGCPDIGIPLKTRIIVIHIGHLNVAVHIIVDCVLGAGRIQPDLKQEKVKMQAAQTDTWGGQLPPQLLVPLLLLTLCCCCCLLLLLLLQLLYSSKLCLAVFGNPHLQTIVPHICCSLLSSPESSLEHHRTNEPLCTHGVVAAVTTMSDYPFPCALEVLCQPQAPPSHTLFP